MIWNFVCPAVFHSFFDQRFPSYASFLHFWYEKSLFCVTVYGKFEWFYFCFFICFVFVGNYHKVIDLSLETQIIYQNSFWVLMVILIRLHEVRKLILNVSIMTEWAEVLTSTKCWKGVSSLTASWLDAQWQEATHFYCHDFLPSWPSLLT